MVDDDRDFRDILSAKLTASGLTVYFAINGAEGLAKAQELHPDLILLDLDMPVMNGVEMFRRLKSDQYLRKIKVVFLTNFDEPDVATPPPSEGGDLRALGYIRKSDNLDILSAYIQGMVLSASVRDTAPPSH